MLEPSKVKIFCPDGEQRNIIPDSKPSTGFASYEDGFPPESQLPLDSGGVAPQRKDFNGLFYILTSALRWMEEGGLWAYDGSIDYVPGAVVTQSGVIYRCKTANGPSSTVKSPSTDTASTYWIPVLSSSGVLAPAMSAYPVGSVYITTAEGDPSALLGFGVWERIQGRFLLSADDSHDVMSTGGSERVTLTTAQMPSHSHTSTAVNNGGHVHTVSVVESGSHTHTVTVNANGSHAHTGTAENAGAHTHSLSINSGGSHHHGAWGENSALSSQWPYGVYNSQNSFIGSRASDADNQIYNTSTDGSHTHTGSTASNGVHSHILSINNAGSHTHTATAVSAGGHAHSATTATAGNHTHAITVDNSGGSQSHENMPPYLAVNMWRRTA